MHPINDLIIRMQPYPQELKKICRINPDFKKALKNSNPKRFISLGAIVTSLCPLIPEDEIIGFFTYDCKEKIFKQDFIVNKNSENKEFILYTRFSGVNKSKNIKDIRDFFQKYPTYSKNCHHLNFEELPNNIKPRALETINLANKLEIIGQREYISDEDYERIDSELKKRNL